MSVQFVWSAQDVCATRLCAAQGCPDEASGSGIALCTRHDKEHRQGHTIPLHHTPPPGEPVLWCSTCKTDKPDAAFALVRTTKAGSSRRGRYHACKDCEPLARRNQQRKRQR